MVECKEQLDLVFQSLSDPTRRDILRRVTKSELSVNELAKPYEQHMSLAAVSKHLKVLQSAHLIQKRRMGKKQLVRLSPFALKDASHYMEQYRKLWEDRLDRLEDYISNK